MLKLKKSFSLHLPRLDVGGSKPMNLSPVTVDSDELTKAVISDPDAHDDNWELTDRPDEAELEAYWNQVEADVQKDPSWFRFDN
jgi:hypothetical protein